MILEEDPAALIRHTIHNFNIQPDRVAISRIHDSLSTLQSARDLRINDSSSQLKRLTRTLSILNSQHEELVSQHSSTAHASEIARLDTQKFRIAKACSDLEMEGERLASAAADLGARLAELESQGVEGDATENARRKDPVEDEVLLRLKVYRSLGIEIERDGKDGEFARAVIRNDRKGDVHVVNIDKNFSRFFYANYFWNTL
ncbi:putative Kinetochore protein Spc24 [Seiridium cardinale]|uniref:Kinetochore protein Spc24 n=1 Tax=Seiridium cardinale TaxID=138064 RepID=A0ABR2XS57_9PEZI